MKRPKRRSALAATVILFAFSPLSSLFAQEEGESTLRGSFRLGYRSVDVNGVATKFNQHLNLDDGPRLFDFSLNLSPASDFADEIRLDLNNLGGDPYESMSLSVRKFGRFQFDYQRRESLYFYHDIILPVELGSPALANAGDFHTFDFERVRDRASLKITLSPQAKLDFSFDRFSKTGASTTTLDIQRDEFELDRPIDETMDEVAGSFQYAWDKITLIFEERVREYENLVNTFLPGSSLGEDPEDATTLGFFFLNQPYDFESFQHTARIHARPNKRLLLRVAASLQSLDLDTTTSEEAQGTDFRGTPFASNVLGGGEVDRDVELLDIDLSYLLSSRVALVVGVRQHNLEQEGAFSFGIDLGAGAWDVDTTGLEVGVEWNVSQQLNLAGGVRQETRDVDFGHATGQRLVLEPDLQEEETDHTGYFGQVSWQPSKRFRLNVELEESSYDDSFTLASPTDRQRLRLEGRLHLESGLLVSGDYVAHRFANNNSGWDSDRDQVQLRLGYRQERIDLSVGYSFVDTEREVNQIVTTLPGFGGGQRFLFPVLFESEADFMDGRVSFRASDRLKIGGDFRFYDNDGDFAVSREDLRAFAEIELVDRYILHLGLRTVDYEEEVLGFNNYDADIAEVAVGYRF